MLFFLHLHSVSSIIQFENCFQFVGGIIMTYNTKQKDKIYDVIKKQNHEFTVKDIYNELDAKIGLTTIYRLVDNLVSNGIVNKRIGKDNITYYQYLEKCECENHFYLRCESCGDMTHIDCDCIGELKSHINNEHKFNINSEQIIIDGICRKCGEKNEKNI